MQPSVGITTGRFAPTPSGPLHFGSLVTAVASYCHAKSMKGKWLVRIEDLDTPRVTTGAADDILLAIEAFGFEWDDDVLYQSQRFQIYQGYLDELIQLGIVYGCNCSRKKLLEKPHHTGPLGTIYGGYCRHKHQQLNNIKLRLNTEQAGKIEFTDQYYGTINRDIDSEIGDIILKRQDGIYAYHLAVVIDDALQQVNYIVRGADLIDATCVHLYLNRLFGFPDAQYLHVPLVKNKYGEKLSKQSGATALSVENPEKLLLKALHILGQNTPAELSTYKPVEILQYAITHWDSKKILNHSANSSVNDTD